MAPAKFVYPIQQVNKFNQPSETLWLEWNGSALNLKKGAVKPEGVHYSQHWILQNSRQVSEIEKTFGVTLPSWPPEKYVRSREVLCKGIAPERKLVRGRIMYHGANRYIPTKLYWKYLYEFAEQVAAELEKCDLEYWRLSEKHKIDFQMHPQVDLPKVKELLSNPTVTGKDALRTLVTERDGKIVYGCTEPFSFQRGNTITGRMTWKSGPNVLNLKKEYRSLFLSTFGDKGHVWSFDYTSLEPRILLLIRDMLKVNPLATPLIGSLPRHTLTHNHPEDIYLKVLGDLGLENKVPRQIAKIAILSTIYGQNQENTAKNISQYIDKPHDFLNALGDYFGIEALQENLARDFTYSNRNAIRSFYGRPVICEDARPSRLLNYYIQSTAVDAALSGFSRIVNPLKEKEIPGIIGLFCLHDAIVFDICADSDIELQHIVGKIEKQGSHGILGFESANFFLKGSPFAKQKDDKEEGQETADISVQPARVSAS